MPIWKFGSEGEKTRYLHGLCNGTLIAVNAMSEPGSGSDSLAMSTTARKDGNGFRLNGTKTFASNAPIADLALVFAVTDTTKGFHGGISAFLIEQGTAGYQAGKKFDKMGLRTSPMGELVFDDVYVSAETVLAGSRAGCYPFYGRNGLGATCLFASHVGTMERLLGEIHRLCANADSVWSGNR